ncbi:MAG TPA: lytic transglycosylase domain-containing protein, partial [Mycobacteriales bacterium]
ILRPTLPTGGHATMGKSLYVAAAKTCPGLSWTVLAAIGGIESDHGADTSVSSAGAEGPMQFEPATFAQYAVDGDGDGLARIDDPYDAVYTAARMLCSDGAGRGGAALTAALFAYNHAVWYPPEVLSLAARYAGS